MRLTSRPVPASGRRPGPHGFTLIELLVMVALLSILAAILFPYLSRSRQAGNRLGAVNNVQQIAVAEFMYYDAHGSYAFDPIMLIPALPIQLVSAIQSGTPVNGYRYTITSRRTNVVSGLSARSAGQTTKANPPAKDDFEIEVMAEPVDYDQALDRVKATFKGADAKKYRKTGQGPDVKIEPVQEAHAYQKEKEAFIREKAVDTLVSLGFTHEEAANALNEALSDDDVVDFVCSTFLDTDGNGFVSRSEIAAYDYEAALGPILGGATQDFVDCWDDTLGPGATPKISLAALRAEAKDLSAVTVDIEVKPNGTDGGKNPINLKSKGVVPVAIFSDPDFDASTVVPGMARLRDPSLPDSVAPIRWTSEDVDGDGLRDLLLFFATEEAVTARAIDSFTAQVRVTARLADETRVTGVDAVTIVP